MMKKSNPARGWGKVAVAWAVVLLVLGPLFDRPVWGDRFGTPGEGGEYLQLARLPDKPAGSDGQSNIDQSSQPGKPPGSGQPAKAPKTPQVIYIPESELPRRLALSAPILDPGVEVAPEMAKRIRGVLKNYLVGKGYVVKDDPVVDKCLAQAAGVKTAPAKPPAQMGAEALKCLDQAKVEVDGLALVLVHSLSGFNLALVESYSIEAELVLLDKSGKVLGSWRDEANRRDVTIALDPLGAIITIIGKVISSRVEAHLNDVLYEWAFNITALVPGFSASLKLPQIMRVVTNLTDQPFKLGDKLMVGVEGDRALKASFDLGKRKNIPMAETQPGVYQGAHVIQEGEEIRGEQVVVRLTAADGSERLWPVMERLVFADGQPPAPPAELKALAKGGQVSLSWTSIDPDVAAFIVQRSLEPLAGYQDLATVNRFDWTDAQAAEGKTYYYRVAARDKVGNLSRPAMTAGVLVPFSGEPGLAGPLEGVKIAARYRLEAEAVVPAGQTLELSPGVVILAGPAGRLIVQGILKAKEVTFQFASPAAPETKPGPDSPPATRGAAETTSPPAEPPAAEVKPAPAPQAEIKAVTQENAPAGPAKEAGKTPEPAKPEPPSPAKPEEAKAVTPVPDKPAEPRVQPQTGEARPAPTPKEAGEKPAADTSAKPVEAKTEDKPGPAQKPEPPAPGKPAAQPPVTPQPSLWPGVVVEAGGEVILESVVWQGCQECLSVRGGRARLLDNLFRDGRVGLNVATPREVAVDKSKFERLDTAVILSDGRLSLTRSDLSQNKKALDVAGGTLTLGQTNFHGNEVNISSRQPLSLQGVFLGSARPDQWRLEGPITVKSLLDAPWPQGQEKPVDLAALAKKAQELKEKGLAAFNKRAFGQAYELLQESVGYNEDREARLYLVYVLDALNETAELEKQLAASVARYPHEVKFFIVAVRRALAAGDKKKAKELLDRALTLNPGHSLLLALKDEVEEKKPAPAPVPVPVAAAKPEGTAPAPQAPAEPPKDKPTQAAAAKPAGRPSLPAAKEEQSKGLAAFNKRDYAQAQKHFEAALKQQENLESRLYLVYALNAQKNSARLSQELTVGMDKYPQEPRFYNIAVRLALDQGRKMVARSLLEEGLKHNPGHPMLEQLKFLVTD